MLVDDYSFAAYNAAGLSRIGENSDLSLKGVLSFRPPSLSSEAWKEYSESVATLAPIPKGEKWWKIPEGVTRLGATFAIEDNNIVCGFEEGIPGDTPIPDDIIAELLGIV